MTAGDGNVSRVRLSWRARCGGDHGYASASLLLPPFTSATMSAVQDSGTYRVTDSHGYRARITVRMGATLAAGGWSGTLAVRVMVGRGGKVVDQCSVAAITWAASVA